MPLNAELIELLACPVCRKPVQLNEDETELECTGCHRSYPIRDGIPIMLREESREATTPSHE